MTSRGTPLSPSSACTRRITSPCDDSIEVRLREWKITNTVIALRIIKMYTYGFHSVVDLGERWRQGEDGGNVLDVLDDHDDVQAGDVARVLARFRVRVLNDCMNY